ncbi:MAG: type II toxin-antitoxin system RelE/ParE family toxin [Cyclobacteriaceae bacterium]
MKVIYTDQAIDSLEESIKFYKRKQKVPTEKIDLIITQLFDRADSLAENPYLGQLEDYLEYLGEGHRRVIEGHFKIIYKIYPDYIIITDFFDTRQNPEQING